MTQTPPKTTTPATTAPHPPSTRPKVAAPASPTLADVNMDPMDDVSVNPEYNPERDPPLSPDEALSAVASTVQAHHIDTKAYKQQFEDEQAMTPPIRPIAIPGTAPPDNMEYEAKMAEWEEGQGRNRAIPDTTRAEMDAGAAALKAYGGRGAEEQAAGRKAVEQRRLTHPE